ncbi:MAG: type II toxin-antitoxin system MqsA family antitoxin [Desulfuromonadales bacterium]|nr:type II toxin-antitoxin system MqsA family antitoxin [Desulfuromonadales bacterium]
MEKGICPICASEGLERKETRQIFEYKGKSIDIDKYIYYKCSVCEESIVDKDTLKRSGKVLKDFERKVDGLLTSKEIKKIRKKLNLTQDQISSLLGGGLKAFSRYENCQVTQSKVMDNLLRVLDKYPTAINVIKPQNQRTAKIKSIFEYRDPYRYQLFGDITPADADVKLEAMG